jgi:gas vesicle protein
MHLAPETCDLQPDSQEAHMYEIERDRSGSGIGMFAIGAIVGAAIGAALGLLYAPRSGAETRSQLSQQGTRLRARLDEQTAGLRERANEAYQSASETFGDVVARGREAVNVGRDAFNKAKPNGSASEGI